MMNKQQIISMLAAFALAAVSSETAQAASTNGNYVMNFDALNALDNANSAVPAGLELTYHFGVNALTTLGDGSDGPLKWQIDDTSYTPAYPVVDDPSSMSTHTSYGAAPSGLLALNAVDGPILLTLATPVDLATFSVSLDNSTFGNLGDSPILFFDNSDTQIASLSSFQSIPGYVATNSSFIGGVSYIVLPSNAFYDNVTLNVVPEPSTYVLLFLGLGVVLFAHRRRAVNA